MQQKILGIKSLLEEASDMGVAGCKETIEFLDDVIKKLIEKDEKISEQDNCIAELYEQTVMLREQVEHLNRSLKGNYDCEG